MIVFYQTMLFFAEFELAITPRYAGHYAQLRLDVIHWQGALRRHQLRGLK